jgi:hypothetical protein
MKSRPWKWCAVAAAALAIGAAGIALSYSQDVSDPRLGPDWQCAESAIFVTTCAPLDIRVTGAASAVR